MIENSTAEADAERIPGEAFQPEAELRRRRSHGSAHPDEVAPGTATGGR